MNYLNYDEVINKITKNYKTRVKIDRVVLEDKEKENILKELFKDFDFINKNIKKMNITYTENYYVLSYDVFNYKNNSLCNNICICRDNIPLIKVCHEMKKVKNQMFSKDFYYSYLDNGKIDTSTKVCNIVDSDANIETNYVNLLNYKDFGYNKIDYIVYYNNNKHKAIIYNGEILLENELEFESKYTIINKENNMCVNKFINSLDNILGIDIVKKYSIKRKNK